MDRASEMQLQNRLKGLVATTYEVLTAPLVRVEMFGGGEARQIFEAYTARHPRFKMLPRKRWGVALLGLPDTFEEYLRGKSKELVRRRRKHALSLGFHFRAFAPKDHVSDILSINTSLGVRQGVTMEASYTDVERVRRFCERNDSLYGVFNPKGRLSAYTHAPLVGDAFVFNRLLGHAEDLEQGVMYLLLSEVIAGYIESKRNRGYPSWASYDTFWGASAGLAFFKRRIGFQPYRVDWTWRDAH